MKNETIVPTSINSASNNAVLANQIVGKIGNAKTPAKRTRFTVELPNGLKVQTRSTLESLSNRFADKKIAPVESEVASVNKAQQGDQLQTCNDAELARSQSPHDDMLGSFFKPKPFKDSPIDLGPHDGARPSSQSVDPAYLARLERMVLDQTLRLSQMSLTPPFPVADPYGHGIHAFAPHPNWQTIHGNAKLSERMPTFLSWVAQKKYSRTTLIDYRFTLRVFAELVGDKRLCDLNVDDADAFLQAMNGWPVHASKKREFRLMKAPEVLVKAARLGTPTLSMQTQQKHIERLKVFFKWLEQRHEARPGLLSGVRLYRNSLNLGKPRKPFDEEDLKIIFDTKFEPRLTTPWRFWAPRLALFQGMRVNEISQLYLDDIIEVRGIPCISINKERPGQRLKNLNSCRLIPIHPKILQAGFMVYVQQARLFGLPHLFPSLTWGVNGPGDTVGDWFNRFLRTQCNITDSAKTFHSFRHCFATWGERSKVSDARMSLMLGHSAGQSVYRTHYVCDLSAEDTFQDLTSITFPDVNIGLYDPRKHDWYFERAKAEATRKERLEKVYGPA
jgi:integrase